MSLRNSRSRRPGHPSRSRPWASKSSERCAICGKSGADRPWRWPERIKLFADFSHAHYKCLAATQRVRTEWSSGSVHERWQNHTTPLGSPRKILQEHRRRAKTNKRNKTKQDAMSPRRAFCGTVRRAPSIRRTGDSLAGKIRVTVPLPPQNPLLLSPNDYYDKNKGPAERFDNRRADENQKKKKKEREAFLRILPPTKESQEMPLVIPENMGLKPATPQLDVHLGPAKKKKLAIRVLMTEEPLFQSPAKSQKWRF